MHPFQSSKTQTTSNTKTVHTFQSSEIQTSYSNVFWGCLFCYLCGLTNSWLLFVGTSLPLPAWNVEFISEWSVLGINPIVSQILENEMTALYFKSMQHNSLNTDVHIRYNQIRLASHGIQISCHHVARLRCWLLSPCYNTIIVFIMCCHHHISLIQDCVSRLRICILIAF